MTWVEGVAIAAVVFGVAVLVFLFHAWERDREKRKDMKRHIDDSH